MLLKFFGHEQGGVDYLLANPTAKILKGDPDITRLLIDSLPAGSGQRFTAGVISEITKVTATTRQYARMEAEDQMRGGLPGGSLDFLWVRHKDKGRKEDHFLVPHLELVTGKKYTPYLDRIDRYRIRSWVEKFNLLHNLPDPNSIIRLIPDYSRSRLSANDQALLMKIWELVDAQIKADNVTDRTEMVAFLRRTGYIIRDTTFAAKPLQQLAIARPDGTPLRLKGSYYFRADFNAEMLSAPRMECDPEFVQKRIQELERTIRDGLEFRAFHSIGHLFGRGAQQGVEKWHAKKNLQHLVKVTAQDLLRDAPANPMFSEFGIENTVVLMETFGKIPDFISAEVNGESVVSPVANVCQSDCSETLSPPQKKSSQDDEPEPVSAVTKLTEQEPPFATKNQKSPKKKRPKKPEEPEMPPP